MQASYFIRKAIYYLRHKPIILNEPGLQRMLPCIPGWLEKGHIYCFDYAIKNIPENYPILEIGTFAGLSTNVMLYFLKKHKKNNVLYTTDWYLRDIQPDENICYLKDPCSLSGFLKESFVRNTRFFNPDAPIFSYDFPSDDFFAWWNSQAEQTDLFGNTTKPAGKIAFAYIDGNHQYDYAKRDFENVDSILIPGGFILFDDSAGYTRWGSRYVAIEALKSGKYRVIKQNPHYFVQKVGE